jgi:hypothetical protein
MSFINRVTPEEGLTQEKNAFALLSDLSKIVLRNREIIHVEPKKHFVVCRSGLGMQYGLGR